MPLKPYKAPNAFSAGAKRAGRGAKNAYANFASEPGTKKKSGEAFGAAKPNVGGLVLTGTAGATGGSLLASTAFGDKERSGTALQQNVKNKRVHKSRAHLITDLGTAASKGNRVGMRRAAVGGLVGGGALAAAVVSPSSNHQKKIVERQYKSKKNQAVLASIGKAQPYLDKRPINRKDKAKNLGRGAAVGGAIGGLSLLHTSSLMGMDTGRLLKPGKGPTAAMLGGGAALGAAGSAYRNHKDKHVYEAKVKKSNTSAFGVDHG